MALDPDDNQLPCGVSLDTLLAQIADQLPAPDPTHQARCSYCQTALRALRQSWGDMQTLARAPVPIPPELTARIMTRIRDLAHRAIGNIILAGVRGHTQISHHVAAQIARRAALAVPGVLLATVQPTAQQPADPARVNLAVRLITTYGPPLHTIAARARTTLTERVHALTGANLDTIDITFPDIANPDTKPKDSHDHAQQL
jgi:uncharacterized alkaline shock family protein YloU